ncbi:MAG TPA: FHA domain-containing protein [Paraburkholderia sp.]|jgi:hypothetical protein|nr:FHA domain-containing protein [Paraburkholderia sp.]
MSEKPIWSSLSKLFGGGQRDGTGRGGDEHTCPNGHPMDPSWTSCPRCEAEKRAQERSADDAMSQSFSETPERSSSMSRNTIISSDPQPQGRGATRVDPGDEGAPEAVPRAAPRRKITGVLVTFTWDHQGDLFILYEGRNVIGKGYVESEGGRPCDVLLTADSTLSNEHAVILCRAGRYELFDRQSTNGTFVDGQFVESHGVELKDGAHVKTGATIWLFRRIEMDANMPGTHPQHRDPPQQPSGDESRVR